ncbi:protein of unknown function [Taphrina deformans PYCC 5710]|uniref:RNase H type-1 domain-containing protein n=1 Tax=Taphrina deformans (strain PYCC 5710 / ATCC 11124 / CBS 356.35 / IMI 108563 / JCM 9778 / NBRC 8474) TaxID=1097556 RepID=R4XGB9_TAPDE|nr:protein of unknown function [Taphrina deformans PYCC 5710]|eukprot:CCG84677.1 protein of unknown function [Taphrina deformans PYCC 5710]
MIEKSTNSRNLDARDGWVFEDGTLKGELYWKWLLQVVGELDLMGVNVRFEHIKAHTEGTDERAILNDRVDNLAKAAHEYPVPIAPFPSFMSDVSVIDATGYATDGSTYQHCSMNKLPEIYERTFMTKHKTTRGFTTKVLHEIKIGVYETRARRFDIFRHAMVETDVASHGLSPLCDCGQYESVHHIFAVCELYNGLKHETEKAVMDVVNQNKAISRGIAT